MVDQDDDLQELVTDFVTESREHLGSVESDLLGLESGDGEDDAIHRVFRAVHSVKGVAGFLGFENINRLAHTLESVLDLVRKERLGLTGELVSLLLRANDRLREMVDNVHDSESMPNGDLVADLEVYLATDGGKRNLPQGEPHALEDGERVFDLRLTLPRVALALSVPAGEIPDRIASVGRILEGATKLMEACAGDLPRDPMQIRLATKEPPEKVAEALGLEGDEVVPAEMGSPTQTEGSPESHTENRSADKESPATAKDATQGKQAETGKSVAHESHAESIRVSVDLLDRLMNLGGELVLSRNQLLQSHGAGNDKGVAVAAARLSQVVSEVQESIMQTRMQPVGSLFQRLPRIVRDLSGKLAKKVSVEIGGRDVELDRSILEALSDPMTHLVRNALDHGLETPAEREAAGKRAQGTLAMGAAQVGGNVRISISDDGRGIDPDRLRRKAVEKGVLSAEEAEEISDREAINLIFAAGFSTAEKVTDVSGRGVGMDVVRSNIEKIGGHIDVQSTLGRGTTIAITIPLTLAILPAMVLRSSTERYVLAQANVAELVRLRGSDREDRIADLDGRDVLRLRGEVLPLLRLSQVLGYGTEGRSDAATTVVVVETGSVRYGLTVDAPPDAEEIVVKPLGRHLKSRAEYAGATILGDGCVAMILDAGGIAEAAGLTSKETRNEAEEDEANEREAVADFVLFRNEATEWFAVPLGLVDRIQRVASAELLTVGDQTVYRDGERIVPVLRLEDAVSAKPPEPLERVSVLMLRIHDEQIGVVAPEVEDIRALSVQLDDTTLAEEGILGSFQEGEHAIRVLDASALARKGMPRLFADRGGAEVARKTPAVRAGGDGKPRVLFAEDTRFFRDHVTRLLDGAGFDVTAVADGDLAWERFEADEGAFDIVVTDVQMPNCDGLELTRRIRRAGKNDVPVVALTSLSSEEDQTLGREAGVNAYLVKLDDAALIAAVRQHVGGNE